MQRTTFIIAVASGLLATIPTYARPTSGGVPSTYQDVVTPPPDGEQMKDLQTKLDQQGFSPGKIDGFWGPNTSAALRRFQSARGLPTTGAFDQQTLVALSATSTAVSSLAAPITTTGDVTPKKGESATADRAANNASSNAQPAASPAGMAAASGNENQAVATTDANAPQPAHGANSFSKGEAERRIARQGFQDVSDLHKDGTGVWRGTATKDGQHVQVWLDYKGNVGQ